MITTEEYEQAERELTLAEWKRGFRIHAAVYGVVTTGLVVLNVLLVAYTDAWNFYWFPFPMVGWGIGLTFHYLYGVRWGEREIQARQSRVERRARELSHAA